MCSVPPNSIDRVMRLERKLLLMNASIVLGALLLSVGLVYGILAVVSHKDLTEQLDYRKEQAIRLLDAGHPLELLNDSTYLVVTALSLETPVSPPSVRDTLLRDVSEDASPFDRKGRFRLLTFYHRTPEALYEVQLAEALEPYDDQMMQAVLTPIIVFALVLVLFYLGNLFIARRFWRPFYDMLGAIKAYDIRTRAPLVLPDTSIEEFATLGSHIQSFVAKVDHDYHTLKEFTENTAHEVQTPLAVIMAKAEVLLELEHEGLSEEQAQAVGAIHRTAFNLSRLSKTLNLIAKLDNNEFVVTERVAIDEVLRQKLQAFEELFALKQIRLKTDLAEGVPLTMNPFLLDLLLSNLLKNAITHSPSRATVDVWLNAGSLEIANTGKPLSFDTDTLFERFRRGDHQGESLGLGLAIVKKICDVSDLRITYDFTEPASGGAEGMHRFTLHFDE